MSRRNKVRILSQFIVVAVTLTMYSGFAPIIAVANSYSGNRSSNNKEVWIPENYIDDVLESLGRTGGEITKADLETLARLEILMENDADSLNFVNNCTSITEFYLADLSDTIYSVKQIGKLDNLCVFTFDCGANTVDLNVQNCKFLYNNEKIKDLRLYGYVMMEPELVQSMPNLESVAIEIRETMPLDLKTIPSLKEAYIYGDPYDISINLTADDVIYLMNNGVEVYLNNESFEQMKINDQKLNDIISTFNITDSSTDQEKLDAIIMYILENFNYDPEIDSMSAYDLGREDKIRSFYVEGYLYGALELKTQICGNYAAFVTAVANRLGLENYMMMSEVHCWNLVKINGFYYYVDTTWMDNDTYWDGMKFVKAEELFESGHKEYLKWYMDKPKSYTDYDHQSYNYPSYLEDELREAISKGVYDVNYVENVAFGTSVAETFDDKTTVAETSVRIKNDVPAVVETYSFSNNYVPNISDEQYNFMVNATLIIIPVGLLFVILTAVCVVRSVKKKRDEKRREKETERYYSEYK